MKLIAIAAHRSEYLEPIHFSKGTLLNIGEKYQGSENWDNWYFCTVDNGLEGWVPTQIIEWINKHQGYAIADYTAKELNVDHGDLLLGEEQLNGWIWCSRLSDDYALLKSLVYSLLCFDFACSAKLIFIRPITNI
ncbi:MAG: hypothetical protein L0G09_14795 [Acinetobacter sp.]|uniref:SH3 domain-containing protein n=1 Tax=Acinetobacter guillouiae TaxID=106649 RepID=UPI001D18DD20|nr:SH3 domain-containing protein [Acinetobacter guillouiae]MDN5418695.1 hypothetical protein [Acinetobacter sp.]